jgi:hypothetical protein
MNRNQAGAVALVLALGAISVASAQTSPAPQTPPASAPAPVAADSQPSNRAPRDASGDADARHCLELATNTEVIACAEKYRSHRARK